MFVFNILISTALQTIFGQNKPYVGDTILNLKDDLEINSIIDLHPGCLLLATEQGLYSHKNNQLLHINGPISVHNICLIPKIKQAVMIINSNRIMITADLNQLHTLVECAPCTKPTLKMKHINVNNLNGFHILQSSDFTKMQVVCTATPKQLIIMKYDIDLQELVAVRILDTAEPTICMHFTQHSLIIGADKFFEIDLVNFEADEFLDASDSKLSHAINCYKIGSFPLAIFEMSKNPTEYIVCFNEFAMFVDEYGRSSRNSDIKWTNLPLAFHYNAPYLYILHFSFLEIIKITTELCSNVDFSNASLKIDLKCPKYLGAAKKGVYVREENEIKIISGRNLDSDTASLLSEDTETVEHSGEDVDSDQFSFTSSMIQSLDGNLSDVDTDSTDNMRQRKVKFAHTAL